MTGISRISLGSILERRQYSPDVPVIYCIANVPKELRRLIYRGGNAAKGE